MQRSYVYGRTEPVGIFGDKYMTDCREEFPRSWFARARLCAEGMTRGRKTR